MGLARAHQIVPDRRRSVRTRRDEEQRPLDQRASIATNELRGTGGLVRGVITTLSSAEHVAALTTGASAPAVSAASGPFDDVEVKQADDLSLSELERLTQPEKK